MAKSPRAKQLPNSEIMLSVVIVNWNAKQLLQACLDSIYSTVGSLSHEVIVVDNASTDGSAAMIGVQYPQVRLLQNRENVGFARANNQAIPLSVGRYILLLNPDTIVCPGALQRLIDFMEIHPESGAVGPKIIHPQGRLRVLSCGYQLGLRTVFNHFFFLSRLFPTHPAFRGLHLLAGVHDAVPMQVEWLSGAALLVRRRVIEEVGLLDERWFMYAEDKEWCDRIMQAGWTLYHVPGAEVIHYFGASSRQNERTSTMWIRSMHHYFVVRCHPSRGKLLLFDLVVTLGLVLRTLIYFVQGFFGKQRAIWWNEARRFLRFAGESMRLLVASLRGSE